MLVQILASSACTGVVCTIGALKAPNSSATTSPERSPTPVTEARCARGIGDALCQRKAPARDDTVEQRLGVRLGEGHAPFAHGVEARAIAVHAGDLQAAVCEAERERKPDSAEAHDRHV